MCGYFDILLVGGASQASVATDESLAEDETCITRDVQLYTTPPTRMRRRISLYIRLCVLDLDRGVFGVLYAVVDF